MINTFIGVGTLTQDFVSIPDTNRRESYLQVISYNKIMLLPVTVDNKTALTGTIIAGTRVRITGGVRSYREKDGNGKWCNRVHIHASTIETTAETSDSSYCHLQGTMLCEPYTTTKGGKPVTQAMIHTELCPGRWYHIPLVAWNKSADYLTKVRKGQPVDIVGNLISRTYTKYHDDTSDTYVTREIVVSRVLTPEEVR